MKKLLFSLVAVLLLPSLAHAGFVNFVVAPSDSLGSTVSYDGAGGPLIGSGLNVTAAVGTGTALNDGTSIGLSNTTLEFTTGSYVGTDGGKGWEFGPGGSLQVVNNTTGEVYLNALFLGDTLVMQTANSYKIIGASSVGTLDPFLEGIFGVPAGLYNAGLTVLFNDSSTPGQGFDSAAIAPSGVAVDVTHPLGTSPVPEPASAVMVGLGLLAMVGARRFCRS